MNNVSPYLKIENNNTSQLPPEANGAGKAPLSKIGRLPPHLLEPVSFRQKVILVAQQAFILIGAVALTVLIGAAVMGVVCTPVGWAAIGVIAVSLVAQLVLKNLMSKEDVICLTRFLKGATPYASLNRNQKSILNRLAAQISDIRKAEKTGFKGYTNLEQELLQACADSELPCFRLPESLFKYYSKAVAVSDNAQILQMLDQLNQHPEFYTTKTKKGAEKRFRIEDRYREDIIRHGGTLRINNSNPVDLSSDAVGESEEEVASFIESVDGALEAIPLIESQQDPKISSCVKLLLTQAGYQLPIRQGPMLVTDTPCFRGEDTPPETTIRSYGNDLIEVVHSCKVKITTTDPSEVFGNLYYNLVYYLEKSDEGWKPTYYCSTQPRLEMNTDEANPVCYQRLPDEVTWEQS